MDIQSARKKAAKIVDERAFAATMRRPPADQRVFVRYPARNGDIIAAGDEDSLREKLAKKIQYAARKRARSN